MPTPTVKIYTPSRKMPKKYGLGDNDFLVEFVGTDLLAQIRLEDNFEQIPGTDTYKRCTAIKEVVTVYNRVDTDYFLPDSFWTHQRTGPITVLFPGLLEFSKKHIRVKYSYASPRIGVERKITAYNNVCFLDEWERVTDGILILEAVFGADTTEMDELREVIEKKITNAKRAWNRKITEDLKGQLIT